MIVFWRLSASESCRASSAVVLEEQTGACSAVPLGARSACARHVQRPGSCRLRSIRSPFLSSLPSSLPGVVSTNLRGVSAELSTKLSLESREMRNAPAALNLFTRISRLASHLPH